MALRDWIFDSGQGATATPATVATTDTRELRIVATVANVSVAREEKPENQVIEKVDWLKPCSICSGHHFTESDRGGYFCVECQTLPEGAEVLRIVVGKSMQNCIAKNNIFFEQF